MRTFPSVSVVIPTRNRARYLRCLLESLDHLTGHIPNEVIVVDGRSTDETPNVLQGWLEMGHKYSATVLDQTGGKGPGQARNLGIRESKNEIIAFTDDDCVVHPQWLEKLTAKLDIESKIIGVGGKVLPTQPDIFSRYYTFNRILEPPASLLYLVSANCCYQRDAVLDAKGFDVDIHRPGGEDVGLSFKLASRGWKFDYAGNAIVFHNYRANPIDFILTFRNYGKGCRQVTEKYFGKGENGNNLSLRSSA